MRSKLFTALALLIFPVCLPVQAATTVTVDDNSQVQVSPNQPQTIVVAANPTAQPVVVAVTGNSADFDGEIERINRDAHVIDIVDTEGKTRQVLVMPEAVETFRAGNFVHVHVVTGASEVILTKGENNRDLEGRIVIVDNSKNTIVVHDAQGHDRRVTLKQGMINNYKVDDYVRIHLMADLKEAKMIHTVS